MESNQSDYRSVIWIVIDIYIKRNKKLIEVDVILHNDDHGYSTLFNRIMTIRETYFLFNAIAILKCMKWNFKRILRTCNTYCVELSKYMILLLFVFSYLVYNYLIYILTSNNILTARVPVFKWQHVHAYHGCSIYFHTAKQFIETLKHTSLK